MENRKVGGLVLGLSVVMIAIVYLFNNAMKKIIETGCPLSEDHLICPAYETVNQQTYLSLAIIGIVIIIGIVLFISKPQEKIIVKKIKEKKKEINLYELTKEEKSIVEILQKTKAIFQAELIERTGMGKVKVSRILDKLDSKNITERKRRGMNNIVVLKD